MRKIFLIISFLLLSSIASAFTFTPDIEEQWSVDIKPTVPDPYDFVDVKATSYLSDFNQATISWYINGRLEKTGVGERSFKFQVGGVGSKTVLRIVILKKEGGSLEKTITFAPSDVSLMYQANTYTPPFYRGKALLSHQSEATVFALAQFTSSNGTPISPDKLVYKWSLDNKVDDSQSGYNKQTFKFTPSVILRPFKISVEVTGPEQGQVATENMTLFTREPSLLFYENNPRLGTVFERAITGTFNLDRDQVVIDAAPYYFGAEYPDEGDIEYLWRINGTKINLPPSQSSVLFTRKNDGITNVTIDLSAKRIGTYIQNTQESFSFFVPNNDAESGPQNNGGVFNF